ncbi:MAG: acyltransferase [Alphaproteobacteria bacterium]|nr:acyltransferase [Alphaproteobacteria bacterium]
MNLLKLFEPAQQPYPKDIRGLTSLRFFAALAVVIFHYIMEFKTIRATFLGRFYLGVDFFFILSGFILAHSYISSLEEERFSFRNFCVKRFARIYPIHFLTLILSASSTTATVLLFRVGFDHGDSFSCFILSLLMMNAWGLNKYTCFNNPSWSISAEWIAYMLFPLLAGWILKRGPLITITVSYAIIITLSIFFETINNPFFELTTHGFIRILPEFTMGIGFYLLGRKYSFTNSEKLFYLLLCAVGIAFVMNVPDAIIVLMYGIIILIVADLSRQNKEGALEKKILVFWGEASYSLYMVHFIFIEALPIPVMMRAMDGSKVFDAPFYIAGVISFILTFFASYYIYVYFEKPWRSWICKKFVKETSQRINQ